MSFNIFGSASRDDIRVGYISTTRGFVDGVSVCRANDYAKKNPGTQFVFKTRDEIKYLSINEINTLNPDDLLPKSSKDCPGIELESDCGPSKVYFYGGGGVGAKANPIIGQDGSLLAVDLVSGGFGYQYAPITEVKDNCGIGAGVVVRSILGEVVETVEYYDQEDDFEDYEICLPTDAGYGRIYSADGKDIGEWDPTLYANLSKDPIRLEIQKYQKFLTSLRGGSRINQSDNTIKKWWTTRTESPISVKSSTRITRVKHDVRHPGWGGEYAQGSLLKEETFKIFTSGGGAKKGGNNLAFNFITEDKSHAFKIRASDFKNNQTGQEVRIKVKPNTVYLVSSEGQYKGAGSEIGIVEGLGKKPKEVNTKTKEELSGKSIFADFLNTANDNDDLQAEAGIGKFSATRIGAQKGRSTYNVKYVFNDNSVYKPEVFEDSFMNNNAVSPVPPSNVPGTDFAGIPFVMEWQKDFPYSGEYTFKGMGDNIAKIYLDNELLFTTTEFRKDQPPSKVKKTVKEGVHRIKVDLYNVPITEKVIKQNPAGLIDVDFKVFGQGKKTGTLKFAFTSEDGSHSFTLKGNEKSKQSRNETIKVKPNIKYKVVAISTRGEIEQGIIQNGKKNKEGGIGSSSKIFADYIASANDNDDIQITAGSGNFESKNKRTAKGGRRSTYDLTFIVGGESNTASFYEEEIISPKSWIENPMGVALVIDAPLPPVPQEPIVEQEGRCPRNPIWSTRFPGAANKWYPVNFSSLKTVTETTETTTTSSSNTQEVEFTIYGQGAFKDLSFVFTAVTGSHTFTLNGAEKNKKTRTEKIKILKNTNYVVYAKEDSKKYTSVEQGLIKGGTKAKEKGIGESKKIFADYTSTKNDNDDIQVTASIGTFKSSNKRTIPNSKRNTYDLTFRLDSAPGVEPQTTTETKTYQVSGWSQFMNRYAISPVIPISENGSDGGGIVYKNSWNLDIPYDGFYALRGTVDNGGRILIDGKEIARGGGLSFKGGSSGKLDGFGTESPQTTKVFLTKGMHSIEVEVENEKTEIFSKVDQKVFNTSDWVVSHTISTATSTSKIKAKFVQKGKQFYLDVTGNGSGEIEFVMEVDDAPYIAGLAAKEVILPSDGDKIKFKRSVPSFPAGTTNDPNILRIQESAIPQKETIKKSGKFTAGKTYGPIEIIGAAAGARGPILNSSNRLGIRDADGDDENIKIIISNIGNVQGSTKTTTSGGLSSGTVKDGVSYSGPVLASYRNGSLGPFLTPSFSNVEDYRTNYQDKTWTLTWNNVDFPVDGQYTLRAEADDYVIVRVDGIEVGVARVFEGVRTFNFNVTKGKRTVEMELYNTHTSNQATFDSNPTVFNAIITVPVDQSTGLSRPWTINPVGISAILIPPPCPKRIRGKGVIKEVIVDDPGNGNPSLPNNVPPSGGRSYPVTLRLKSVIVENPGINHNCGVDEIQITPSNGAVLSYDCDSFGRIKSVNVLDPGLGFTTYPDITMVTDTGINASFRPQFEVVRDPIVADPAKLIQVTDLVGLKQTGYVDGRAYFGAVFYKDGVRYAGFYETPGELVQVYDTLQESITAQVVTRPSAILRQGTDISSNNPRLNLPGTPDTLI